MGVYKSRGEFHSYDDVLRSKIKVFISSICGVEKYDKVRAELKSTIEATKLADVYTFEGKGASTLPADAHYTWALEDSDICIFLIDNEDGINPGVQAEIDTVKNIILRLCTISVMKHKKKNCIGTKLDGSTFCQK